MQTHDRVFVIGPSRYLARAYTWPDLPAMACTEVTLGGEVYSLGVGVDGSGNLETFGGEIHAIPERFYPLRAAMQNWLQEKLGILSPAPATKTQRQTAYKAR